MFECRTFYGTPLWAWGKVDGAGGFSEVTYTTDDGVDFADVEDEPPRLGRFLFVVPLD